MSIFTYLSEAMTVASDAMSANFKNLEGDANFVAEVLPVVDPKLASDPNFQTAMKLLQELAAAEQSGATGVISTLPLTSNGVKLAITVSIGPA